MIKVTRIGGLPHSVVKLAEAEEQRNASRSKKIFAVYSNPLIKDLLLQIFFGKCAYCESKYQATQPMDVEHWRPKSTYWFLAADWNNLYPSCIDCNRQREHTTLLPDGSQEKVVLGKSDQFPVENNSAAIDRGSLLSEKAILIDPCNDDPEFFFEFTQQGVIRSKVFNLRSETSIVVYALNRMGLVHERFESQLVIGKHIHRLRQLASAIELIDDRINPHPNDADLKFIIEDLIRYEMCSLRAMCVSSQPYAAQSRQLVNEFFDSPNGLPKWLTTR